jgi:hypothetical protein
VTDTDYKGSRDVQVTPGCNPNGLDTIHDPKAKNGGVAQRQILDVQLLQWFLLILDEFGYGTSSINFFISLPFQGVQECPISMSYATWASVLMWIVSGWVRLWILNLFQKFWSNLILFGPGTGAIENFISSSFRAYVERPNLILYPSCTSIWSQGGPELWVGLEVKL